jgi:hypothetical protein
MKKLQLFTTLLICLPMFILAQVANGVYLHESVDADDNLHQEKFMIQDGYAVLTQYSSQPAGFTSTKGGTVTTKHGIMEIALDFSTTYAQDGANVAAVPFEFVGDTLVLGGNKKFVKQAAKAQALDGRWLMGGRVTDQGEKRRDITQARKTLKFLVDGHFQWVAFTQGTFEFFGSGGGQFTSVDGAYTEKIEFFSRDNSRVGMGLEFHFDRKENDWYHKGYSSKGKPMHEIWTIWAD